jgi:hypothetical protein
MGEALANFLEGLVGNQFPGFGEIVHHHLHRAIDLKRAYRDERQYEQDQKYGCKFSAEIHRQMPRRIRPKRARSLGPEPPGFAAPSAKQADRAANLGQVIADNAIIGAG